MRQSSIEAHEAVKSQKESHYQEIKSTMKRLAKPATAKNISFWSRLTYHQVQRRLSEMEIKGLIKVCGRDPLTKGRPMLWKLIN